MPPAGATLLMVALNDWSPLPMYGWFVDVCASTIAAGGGGGAAFPRLHRPLASASRTTVAPWLAYRQLSAPIAAKSPARPPLRAAASEPVPTPGTTSFLI